MGFIGKTFQTITDYSKPFTTSIGVAAMGAGFYFRQVALTYGPGIVADWCIQGTIRAVNNVTLGKILGLTVVAPAIVPQVMPIIGFCVGLCGGYLVMVVLNALAKLIFGIEPPKNYTPPPQPKAPPEVPYPGYAGVYA